MKCSCHIVVVTWQLIRGVLQMYESLYPADDIWDKFDIPPVSEFSELLLAVEGAMEKPQVVPSHVMGGRHDCMWAGTCSSGKHQRRCFAADPVVAVTLTVRPVKSSRSLLRTTRTKTPTSPRPDTPSESEEEESPVCGAVCDNEDLSVAVSVSEVTGQVMRISSEFKTLSCTPSPAHAFYTDHSYHMSKTAVTLDNLGVQTPSDSGEFSADDLNRTNACNIIRTRI
jgi:hypothetical protein